jgi:hypothetical protein
VTTLGGAGWDWSVYFKTLGKADPGEVNVSWPPALEGAVGRAVHSRLSDCLYMETYCLAALFNCCFDCKVT